MDKINNTCNYLIKTDDGSTTLFLEEYEQAMHSTSGAYEESLLKHLLPSEILNKRNNPVNILDIGFGLGYNVLALIHEYSEKKRNNTINIISIEKEKTFIPFMNKIKFNDKRDISYELVKKAYSTGKAKEGKINILIKFGDARKIIQKLEHETFDAVFQDPFSPSKNPELWSLEYFKTIYKLMKKTGIMTTYSSANHIRRAMLEAGFYIRKGPSVGKKKEGTLASSAPEGNELSPKDIEAIYNDPRSVPYKDRNLSLERELILQERLIEIKRLKNLAKQYHPAHQG